MAQTITISQSAYKDLVNRLARLESLVAKHLKRFEKEPPYGSNAWWDWSIEKGREDIEKGDYYTIRDSKQLKDFFKNINNESYLYNKFHNKSSKANAKAA